ncbi:hypothetical protein SCH01S_28_01100 [Sphingomonas changbaiensis NBRC 104936]|uniref:Uncharacterized protein n=1 Tax=Sphingomonas changbaiensis NBRC 104936 TaxID=1219043 RepID=A0A0E9MNX1_9SPHN|nr:hypothetical protein [Sphingomonas changbaiensis]GAO39249.1 hypothetical protein SCH01S_28_01100 [Sphingomonas changbaiensis NBRC 104936]
MDLDALLHHYFGRTRLDTLAPEAVTRGREALAIDFGVEQEPGRKFALWVLMHALGIAPLPAEAFPKHPELKRAAEDWLTASERVVNSTLDRSAPDEG